MVVVSPMLVAGFGVLGAPFPSPDRYLILGCVLLLAALTGGYLVKEIVKNLRKPIQRNLLVRHERSGIQIEELAQLVGEYPQAFVQVVRDNGLASDLAIDFVSDVEKLVELNANQAPGRNHPVVKAERRRWTWFVLYAMGTVTMPVSYTHLDVYKRQGSSSDQVRPYSRRFHLPIPLSCTASEPTSMTCPSMAHS